MKTESDKRIYDELNAPFQISEVDWKPQAVTRDKKRAMATAYIDARAVMERLDEVVGIGGWEDKYVVHPSGTVECHLTLAVNGSKVTKSDVGIPPDDMKAADEGGGGRAKRASTFNQMSAFSHAFKRAAVKFGVGRYLYYLPGQWLGWDAEKRCFLDTPRLPPWALPKGAGRPNPNDSTVPRGGHDGDAPDAPPPNGGTGGTGQGRGSQAPPAGKKVEAPASKVKDVPKDGTELKARLTKCDTALAAQNRCAAGDLVRYIEDIYKSAKVSTPMEKWTKPMIVKCAEHIEKFCADHPAKKK